MGEGSTRSGPRGLPKGFQSGSVRGQARRLEMPRLPRVRRLKRLLPLRRKRSLRRKRRRRKRRSKLTFPSSWRNNLATSAPKNIPDWFLLQTICFKESQRFAVLKTKWLCIFYVKLYWIFFSLSTVTNKINTLGMEANIHIGRFCYSRRFLS